MALLKILLAEDHHVVRNGIKLVLQSQADLSVVGEYDNGQAVFEAMEQSIDADLLITDLDMPIKGGISFIREFAQHYPHLPILVLTMLDDSRHLAEAFSAGAKGYLLKKVGAEELIYAARRTSAGGQYLCEELSMRFVEQAIQEQHTKSSIATDPQYDLSERESEVLQLLADGYTNKEIAEQLFLSRRTVEGHRENLINRFGCRNTAVLIKRATGLGLLR